MSKMRALSLTTWKKVFPFFLIPVLVFPVLVSGAPLDDQVVSKREDVRAFIGEISDRHGFDKQQLLDLFHKVTLKQQIIDAISRPAESKPWYQYRRIFVTDSRINEGVAFWNEHRADLERAQQVYGVPPEIIVAILGVETRYGRHKGSYRVMDSLSTLAFAYPQRSGFFRNELEEYLLLTREEALDPLSIKGSYAGAMGKAQFISSSYRNYAVDFDGDGHRDLWENTADAIGSVANYFQRHKWQPNNPVTIPAMAGGNLIQMLVQKGIKPHSTVAELNKYGVTPLAKTDSQALAALIELDTLSGPEYWLGMNNFYVITRYNHSPLYAMAVYQLGQAILAQILAETENRGNSG